MPWDLPAILALTTLLLICVVLTSSNIPRIILGLPFILFCPGYVLLVALFPRRGSLASAERVVLSFVLSMAVVPLLGLVLNFTWEISQYPILITVAAFVGCLCAVAYVRRARLPMEEQFRPHLTLQTPRLQPLAGRDRILAAFLAVLVVGAAAALIYVAARPRNTEHFTDFYVLGMSGTAGYYPSEIVVGASADVTIGIVNREGEVVSYQVRVLFGGSEVKTVDGISLLDGAAWEETIVLAPTAAGDNQQVQFLLYRANESEPYRELHLWIDARDPSAVQ